jgi:hypothetical protein
MLGHEVHFVCADDAHGAPIMIAAEKAGKTPQQFVAQIAAGRQRYLDGFHIAFDNWHSTDAPENHELAQQHLPRAAQERADRDAHHRAVLRPREGHVPARPLHQGRMPELRREGPVRRQLRGLRRRLRAHRPEEPVLGADRRHAGAEDQRALLLQAQRPALRGLPRGLDAGRPPAARGGQQGARMVQARRGRQGQPGRLGHQPRRALLRHRDPRRAGQVLLRLARRAGRLPGSR